MFSLRRAREDDAEALLRIYSRYIETPATFECTLPDAGEFRRRIRKVTEEYPYLVAENDGEDVGYAYAHRMRVREAYQWNAELSVYIDERYLRLGLGTALYGALIELLKLQRIKNVYAFVTAPNAGSERLHRRMGFALAGRYRETGYKCGAWRDMLLFEKQIGEREANPEAMIPAPLADAARAADILRAANESLASESAAALKM